MICPKCGEDNSEQFRFCGMCGSPLDGSAAGSRPATTQLRPPSTFSGPPSPASRPQPLGIPVPPVRKDPNVNSAVLRETKMRENKPAARWPVASDAARQPESTVPPISGPSMLGLNLAMNKRPEETAATATQTRPVEADATRNATDFKSNPVRANEVRVNDLRGNENRVSEYRANVLPSESSRFDDFGTDSFREQSFSGLNSYIEDEPKSGAGRVILLLLLLAALGVAGWWTYNNYRGVAQSRKAQSDAANTVEAPPDSQSTPSASSPAPAPAPTAAAKPPSDVPEGPSENASPAPDANAAPANDDNAAPANAPAHSAAPTHNAPAAKTAEPTPPPAPAKAAPQRVAPAPAHKPAAATAKSSRVQAAIEPEDTGDASFRRAESYLYGRGAAQNCDEAIKNLKAASAKSNAKARSTFGTMYATGHCVPRDLPTSYLWFALALRVDPNNQVLEKDLTAVWNQMTPPERQLATRMKQ